MAEKQRAFFVFPSQTKFLLMFKSGRSNGLAAVAIIQIGRKVKRSIFIILEPQRQADAIRIYIIHMIQTYLYKSRFGSIYCFFYFLRFNTLSSNERAGASFFTATVANSASGLISSLVRYFSFHGSSEKNIHKLIQRFAETLSKKFRPISCKKFRSKNIKR